MYAKQLAAFRRQQEAEARRPALAVDVRTGFRREGLAQRCDVREAASAELERLVEEALER